MFQPSIRTNSRIFIGIDRVVGGTIIIPSAISTLVRAAQQYPGHPYTYVALGRVWLEKAQPKGDRVDLSKALGALQDAVGTDDSSEALTLFGRALLLSRSIDLAETVLQQATEKTPVDPQAYYYLADAAERRGHSDIALHALLDYRALEGDDPDNRRRAAMYGRLGNLSILERKPGDGVAWYQRAIEVNGADSPLLVRLAEAQLLAGSPTAAVTTLQKALDKDPFNRDALALARRLKLPTAPSSDPHGPGAHPQGS